MIKRNAFTGRGFAAFLILILFSLAMLLVSCGSGDTAKTDLTPTETTAAATPAPSPETTAAITPSPTPTAVPEDAFVVPDTSKRPFAVMIDNEGTRSLPQGGLNKAQVIYEIMVEGGETRLMPLFWGTDPTMIGPVRSSRHYFLDYAMENDAIYVHFGWSPRAKNDISKLKINNINGVSNGGEIYWDLTKDRGNWQDSYTSMEKILQFTAKVKYRTESTKTPVFSYNKDFVAIAAGETAEKISIKYSSAYTCGYEYDKTKNTYLRLRKGKPQMERVSEKQLEAVNIIVQFTPTSTIKGDDKGRQEVSTTGSGKGYLITGGKVMNIKWSKAERATATKYTDENGNAISLNPGQTWVQVLPTAGKVTIE
ncbi:MAG: DUF3048 domain-containing protein [Clostridiales bacterium]|nr:DUF3048 domain-containing protein [Clostridiales bacterium]